MSVSPVGIPRSAHTLTLHYLSITSQSYDYSPSALPPTNHTVRRPDYNIKLVVVGDGGASTLISRKSGDPPHQPINSL